jgi:ABC-type amino acid transport substrate-binding protein
MGMPERWTRELGREVRAAIPPPFVELEAIAVTRPYARVEMAVAYAPSVTPRNIDGLDGLAGLRLGIEQGTLAGALTLRQAGAEALSRSITARPGPGFLWELENGRFDAALVSVPAFDFHRLQNPITEVTLGEWRHPLGFNIAFAGLAGNRALLAAADAAIEEMMVGGRLPKIAAQAGLHYAEPLTPLIQPPLSLRDLDVHH